MAAPNTNFDALLTTTLHNYVTKKLEDNVFKQCPTLQAIKLKGGVATAGGDKLVMPLLYGKNLTVKAMTPYGVFDTSPQEGITAAEYGWANLGGSVTIDNFTVQVQNAGEAKVIDLLKEKIQQLELSMVDLLGQQLFAATGRAADAHYTLWSLYDVLNATDADAYTDPAYVAEGTGYGRISIADDAGGDYWWRPVKYYDDGSVSLDEFGTFPAVNDDLSLINMSHIYNACSNGNDTPNLIVMSMACWEKFESLLIATQRSGPDQQLYDGGLEHLRFRNAPVIFDQMHTNNNIYFLNTRYLKFVTCRGREMQSLGFQRPADQDVRTSLIVWSGQLGCNNRRRQGCWTDVDLG